MKQKRLMLLGGIRYLLPVIKAAHEQGYYVITADYIPDNIAHKFSDEYVNVSVIDRDAVLKVGKEKKIDGIMSFGVDPGVVSAAYVQEKMGLPAAGPYQSVEILQNKDLFRQFMKDNHFNVPEYASFSSLEEAFRHINDLSFPVIVKPTDSAGSKGVSRANSIEELETALKYAFAHSIKGRVIVEQFIEKVGCSSDTDCFSVDGVLRFVSFSAQRFDESAANPYTPAAYSWPSTFTPSQEEYLTSEIQRLISLLKMGTSIYNVETRIGKDGRPYIMELTPRGGGNRLAEMLRFSTRVDLIEASVRAAVGDTIPSIRQRPYKGHWAEIVLHTNKRGIYNGLQLDDIISRNLVEKDIWVNVGDFVEDFEGANNAIGTIVMHFDDMQEMEYALLNLSERIQVLTI